MSDGEATDGGSRKTGIKLRLGSGSATPSRAGSPASGSRAGSPALANPTLPTAEEIIRALPSTGISIKGLLAKFPGRVRDEERSKFISIVKANSVYSPEDKLLRPKTVA
jgi:transcription initiation factor TFIIF subunit alpha